MDFISGSFIMETAEKVFSYEYFQENLNLVRMPNTRWYNSKGDSRFFGFSRIENNTRVRRSVVVVSDMSIRIIIDSKIHPFSKFIKISSIEEFSNLLEAMEGMELPT